MPASKKRTCCRTMPSPLLRLLPILAGHGTTPLGRTGQPWWLNVPQLCLRQGYWRRKPEWEFQKKSPKLSGYNGGARAALYARCEGREQGGGSKDIRSKQNFVEAS